MVEIHLDERQMLVSERMTLEAVRVALDCTGNQRSEENDFLIQQR